MSQAPTPYTRQNNFVTDAGNPNYSIGMAAPDLDAEYEAVKTSVNETISRLNEIQRDDGKLKDGIVSSVSLGSDVATLLGVKESSIRGSWVANGVSYDLKDLVSEGTGTYLCIIPHVSSALLSDDINSGYWLTLQAPAPTTLTIPANSITSAELAAGSVTSSELGSSSVTTTKIASGAVVAGNLAAGAVTSSAVSSNSINTAAIQNNAVTGAKMENVAGLTTGTFGSGSLIPKVTIDSKGRVTGVTTTAVSSTFSTNVTGVKGIFSGAVSGTTGTFSSSVSGTNGTFSGNVTGARLIANSGTVGSPGIAFSGDGNTGIYRPGTDSIALVEGGVERLRLNSNGNVMVGTSTQVNAGDGGTAEGITFYAGDSMHISNKESHAIALRRTSNNGDIVRFYRNAQSDVGAISVTTTATTYATSSDHRLKENKKPLENCLEVIESLQPCEFTWKIDGSKGCGFIAHELQEFVPDAVVGEKDAVKENGDPEYQKVDASKIIPFLVAAVKELSAKVAELEK